MSNVIEKMAANTAPIPVYDKMLEALDIQYRVQGASAESIPKKGPLLVVANHPRFGVEGLAIGSLLSKVRPDLKVAMNEMMQTVPGFKEVALGVEMQGDSNAKRQFFRQMRDWLKKGHAVLIFPAGAVSGYQAASGRIKDRPWTRSVPLLAEQTGASILPVHVSEYQPGWTFRLLHRMASPAQKSTFPVEILRQQGTSLDLTLGKLLALDPSLSAREAAHFFQQNTYDLGQASP